VQGEPAAEAEVQGEPAAEAEVEGEPAAESEPDVEGEVVGEAEAEAEPAQTLTITATLAGNVGDFDASFVAAYRSGVATHLSIAESNVAVSVVVRLRLKPGREPSLLQPRGALCPTRAAFLLDSPRAFGSSQSSRRRRVPAYP
jgi:hypothetical protein